MASCIPTFVRASMRRATTSIDSLAVIVLLATLADHASAQVPLKSNQSEESASMDTTKEFKLIPGSTIMRTADGANGTTYHLHVPEDFDVDAPSRPILIAFSPGGNGKGILEKLKSATEAVGWLLVGCDKLRNGMGDHDLEIEIEDEILTVVLDHVPHDPERIYLGGFSAGAMRAYGITARRTEPYAGVLAFGGWLGGPSYQDEPYRENMSVAMVTGVRDRGASGWVPIDTKTLKQRNCSVKHFAFDGGHSVSPPATTGAAIKWLVAVDREDSGTRRRRQDSARSSVRRQSRPTHR